MQDTRQCIERVEQLTKRLEMWARHGDDAGSCEPGNKKAKEKLCTGQAKRLLSRSSRTKSRVTAITTDGDDAATRNGKH